MKILVTGGAGFIGSHVVDAYVAAGHEVAVLLVHGLLHLLGWDHATPAETEEMWRLTYIPLRGLRRSPRA